MVVFDLAKTVTLSAVLESSIDMRSVVNCAEKTIGSEEAPPDLEEESSIESILQVSFRFVV